jgi:hypothetical protein
VQVLSWAGRQVQVLSWAGRQGQDGRIGDGSFGSVLEQSAPEKLNNFVRMNLKTHC